MKAKPDTPAEEARLRWQRDAAVVCAVLSAVLALTMVLNNFGREVPGLASVRETVERHRAILAENRKIIQTVEPLLHKHQDEWDALVREAGGAR